MDQNLDLLWGSLGNKHKLKTCTHLNVTLETCIKPFCDLWTDKVLYQILTLVALWRTLMYIVHPLLMLICKLIFDRYICNLITTDPNWFWRLFLNLLPLIHQTLVSALIPCILEILNKSCIFSHKIWCWIEPISRSQRSRKSRGIPEIAETMRRVLFQNKEIYY